MLLWLHRDFLPMRLIGRDGIIHMQDGAVWLELINYELELEGCASTRGRRCVLVELPLLGGCWWFGASCRLHQSWHQCNLSDLAKHWSEVGAASGWWEELALVDGAKISALATSNSSCVKAQMSFNSTSFLSSSANLKAAGSFETC